MMDDDLANLHAHDLREMVRSKEIAATELTKYFLRRIEKYNDKCHAYDWVVPENALKDARKVDKWVEEGKTDPQLLGVPIILDGAIRTEGIPLSYGCEIDIDEIPLTDDWDAKILKEAGAIILGKGNCSEFGMTATTVNSLSPQAKNPCNPLFSTGGASGGAAVAVANGLAAVGVGPDKNGGVRLPASYCGLTSIKATRGRVPFVREFLLSIITKALTQVSPMGRCVTDVAMVLNVLAQSGKTDSELSMGDHANYEKSCHEPLRPLRIGWIPQFGELPVESHVAEICERGVNVLASSGFTVEKVDFDIDSVALKHYCNVFSCEHYIPIVSICEKDKSGVNNRLMRGTHRWLNYAKAVSGVSISAGVNHFNILREKFSALFREYDLLISPASVMTPFTLEEVEEEDATDGSFMYSLKTLSYLLLSNLSGHPSIVLPAGISVDGIPIGVNVMAKYGNEDLLLQFAHKLEVTFDLHGKTSFV